MASTTTIQAAHDVASAYAVALRHLAQARAAVEREPEHVAEDECGINHPLNCIADAEARLGERILALQCWLTVHDREAA